ncbi:MAG TPA: hypothetical protein VE595_04080 [Nitrososphaeraceae archaeon]|nr:hypothetical protein [Nitrososphaeraceae archaeon]
MFTKILIKKLLPKITEYGVENKILSLSNVYHIGTTCSIPFLLIVPNFHVKVPYKRTF